VQRTADGVGLSATDLSVHSDCEHRSVLELGVILGELKRPGRNVIQETLLDERGREHEKRVFAYLEDAHGKAVTIRSGPGRASLEQAAAETAGAMRAGAPLVYQAVLLDGSWLGRPDFLVRTAAPDPRGAFSYEVIDAKLSRELRVRAVLQLAVYSAQLETVQGVAPERFGIAPMDETLRVEWLRTADYAAYYRRVRAEFEAFLANDARKIPYPEPVEHCDVCPWWKRCDTRRRDDDHLSLVAGITRRQRSRLEESQVTRVVELGELGAQRKVDGLRTETLARLGEQARLQVASRKASRTLYELLPDTEDGTGLETLPERSPGDVFLDLEGDPHLKGRGLEYLFGLLELDEEDDYFGGPPRKGPPVYRSFWASNPAEERLAFEQAVDRMQARFEQYPGMHVYHFGHRENDALKRLANHHGTRVDVIDEWLRRHSLIDLHRAFRQGIRASVESYSLKELEPLWGFVRATELRDAKRAMQKFTLELEIGEPSNEETVARRQIIAAYNREDCLSTLALRDWLEQRRPELASLLGRALGRPPEPDRKVSEETAEARLETERVAKALLHDVGGARRLLASLLDWHAREAKAEYWEHFRARDVAPEDRLEDRSVLTGLRLVGEAGKVKQSIVYRYEFPEQEHGIRQDTTPIDPANEGETFGTVLEIGTDFMLVKKGKARPPLIPSRLVPSKPLETKNQRQRLLELGKSVVEHGLETGEAARDLLCRRPPRLSPGNGGALVRAGEDPQDAVVRLARSLDRSVLAIQGPPGSGKTTCAARTIVALVRDGRRVGVTAQSHKVILQLLRKADELAKSEARPIRVLHVGDESNREGEALQFDSTDDHADVAGRLTAGAVDLVGGTAWTWTRPEYTGLLDVLVVDEAGQVSLANALAVSRAAKSMLLFGDPAQLEQPRKGSHPEGAEVSALEHLLEKSLTLPADIGVFLPKTRRLHPAICAFTSEVFYDGRLDSIESLSAQRIGGPGLFDGAGLRFVPVDHRGNTNSSREEVDAIRRLLEMLFAAAPTFVDERGQSRPLVRSEDVLVVAPYNVQVAALRRALGDVRIGTVDKFQGQEAPIVVYSMTSSSAEDAPRGMEFLYSLDRLNVATSRARALVVLVASPEIARARCRTPRQMRLANALCRYLELAM
jgi:predicted RecB family nuclease